MINSIFKRMSAAYVPGVLDSSLSFYFSIDDQKKTVFLTPQSCRVEEGKATENADCVCKTSVEFFIRIWEQDYRPGLKDFLSGTIRSNNPEALKTFLTAFGK
jgi:putative sterol carrier protein